MNRKFRHMIFLPLCMLVAGMAEKGSTAAALPTEPDLPVTEVKASNESLPLILYLSGDGGYNTFSQGLVNKLSGKGYGVLILDARKYFWKAKTPQQLASDMTSLLTKYLRNRRAQQVIVMGYSFGASVVPFMLNRLPADLTNKVKAAVCISPGRFADFEVTFSTLVNNSQGNKAYPVVEESRKLSPLPIHFLFGRGEDVQTTRFFVDAGMSVVILPGNHDYGNDIDALSRKVLAFFQ